MPPPPPHLVHPSNSLEETTAFWYTTIRGLGWNRSPADGATHHHAAQDGKTWLLLTPQSTSATPSSESNTRSEINSGSASPAAKPEGCILALAYPNRTGWIGFFLMSAAYRGLGLGAALWSGMDAIWEREGTEIIGLDGVEEQVPTYKRRGFVDVGRIPLMVCDAGVVEAIGKEGVGEDIKDVDREQLASLDLELSGLDRRAYWVTSGLLEREDVFGYTHYAGSKLVGFVLVRGCEEGHRVGPLFAPSTDVAALLLRRVMQHPAVVRTKGSLIAEVFGANVEAKKVFASLGWREIGVEYHRMWYKGRVPEAQAEGGLGTKGMFAIFDAACG